jgi:hypothetical protein
MNMTDTETTENTTDTGELAALGSLRSSKIVPKRTKRAGVRQTQQFESGEHENIGDSRTLYFESEHGVADFPANEVRLRLRNGLGLSYGNILALGGDFYGLPKMPISDGADDQNRDARFEAAFATLAVGQGAVEEVPRILEVMQEEIAAVDAARRAGKQPSIAYEALGDSLSMKWNRITKKSWTSLMGRYLELAETNWDHFGENAVLAYQAGHRVAMLTALYARELETAYAMNAFADHFMTDLFSSGHMRTPRKALYNASLTPAAASGYVARYMHDEDCMWGLRVENRRGDTWIAYGDKKYADTYNQDSHVLVNEAVQASIDEVFDAFDKGVFPEDPSEYTALKIAPDIRAFEDPERRENYAAFFIVDGKKRVRARSEYKKLESYKWTKFWTVGTTLTKQQAIAHRTKPPGIYLAAPGEAPSVAEWIPQDGRRAGASGKTKVRYAMSVYRTWAGAMNESNLGPWSDWADIEAESCPVINVPAGDVAEAEGRRIYRQIRNEYPQFAGQLAGNQAATFTDYAYAMD